jgi:hypothetical protein
MSKIDLDALQDKACACPMLVEWDEFGFREDGFDYRVAAYMAAALNAAPALIALARAAVKYAQDLNEMGWAEAGENNARQIRAASEPFIPAEEPI